MPEYSCKMKTLFLFVLIIVVFVIIYTQNESNMKLKPQSNSTLNQSLNKLEKFLDLIELTAAQNPTKPVPADILSDYEKLLNPILQKNLISSGSEAKRIFDVNQNKMSNQLNLMDSNIQVVMDEVNTKLYKQLGENYERAQQINNIRADWLSNINDLPYANIS